LGVEKLERREQCRANALAPASFKCRRARYYLREPGDALIERRQNAVFDALENIE
jgi:hypothetical protein